MWPGTDRAGDVEVEQAVGVVLRVAVVDTHYTPKRLATALVDAAPIERPTIVADLAAGAGDLLRVAEARWPEAQIVATDIDRGTIDRLRRRFSGWDVGRCDMRNAESRRRCSAIVKWAGQIDLLLLNPPYSCRGGETYTTSVLDTEIASGASMSFLLEASALLAPAGHVVALLPSGSLHSAKDACGWAHLHAHFRVEMVDEFPKGSFPRSSAHTTLVRFSPHMASARAPRRPMIARIDPRIVRGTYPRHLARRGVDGLPVVHTTQLRDGVVTRSDLYSGDSYRSTTGPAVLLPRVGQLTSGKIAVLADGVSVILSDCVLSIEVSSTAEATRLKERLLGRFSLLQSAYRGTGAPYTTMAKLSQVLSRLNGASRN